MSVSYSHSDHSNLPTFQGALINRNSFLFPSPVLAAANAKTTLRNLFLIAFLALCAANSAHAQTCSAMSLGNGASLNGFVPFPSTNAWNTNIASLTPDPNSAAIVAAAGFAGLSTHVNFGSSVDDGGIPYVIVDSTQTPSVPINVIDYASESDVLLAPYPPTAPIEGAPADCTGWPDTYQGDAHVLVLDRTNCVLYETFNTNRCNGQYNASSETIWDMHNYESRPWGWTSADAAGLPIFPGLVRYDEVAAGAINHAIRFTMEHTKNDANGGYFVEPASHAAGTEWGVSNIMGMRIRLKATFDISGYSPVNQVILTALKQYGMILADNGGSLFIQGATDPRWDDSDLHNLGGIPSSEFDVMPMTPEFPGWDSATAPTGSLPVIDSFAGSPTSVSSGSPVTFTYTVTGDSYDYIDMIGPVAAGTGSVTINPTATQTYTLYSTNAYGQTASTPILVTVPGSVVAPPTLTPPGASYSTAQTVTISTATYPYAAIYYTTDGSTPTYPVTGTTKAYPVTPTPPNSQGNVNSITVASSETVKAIAVVPGYSAPSAVSSATYIIGGTSAVPAVLTSPTPGTGTVLGTTSVVFQWTTGTSVTDYQLNLSAIAAGDSDLFSYKGTATTATAATLPGLGVTVYARLYSNIAGLWQYNDYQYTEHGTPTPAALTSPLPGAILGTTSVLFQWTAGIGVSLYQLNLSAVAPGDSELYLYKGALTSATAPTLPANNAIVYARLYSYISGAWEYNDYQYTENGPPTPATLTSPTPGLATKLGTSSVAFQWTAGGHVSLYQLNLSAVAPGGSELYLYKGSAKSVTVATLPANGATVYATLYSDVEGVWQPEAYEYTESGTPTPATLTSPTPGLTTKLGTSSVPFQWSSGGGVSLYQLDLSATTKGAGDLYSYKGTALTTTVPTIPANGVTVYATLYSLIKGTWQSNSYVYTESGSPTLAALTSPTPGISTILGTTNVLFQWSAATSATLYQLNLSAVTPGGSDLYSYKGAALSATAPTLPANGAKVYARLYSYIDGAWFFNDYVYTEQ
ncbi:MAG: chitobiase/beta-hexosaminidase C-terminal domain-containing protein [Terracidiphilus sp.]|jgi:hypothetical protein